MKYSDIRDKIKSGDLIALGHEAWETIGDIESQIVRVVTQSEYSHVCVAWVFAGRVFVIEAVKPKIRLMPLSNMLKIGAYWLPTDTPMTVPELEFGMSKIGLEGYSNLDAIEGQLGNLVIGENDVWQCSELTICMRRLSGLDLGNKATPSAVVRSALEQGFPLNYITEQEPV